MIFVSIFCSPWIPIEEAKNVLIRRIHKVGLKDEMRLVEGVEGVEDLDELRMINCKQILDEFKPTGDPFRNQALPFADIHHQ